MIVFLCYPQPSLSEELQLIDLTQAPLQHMLEALKKEVSSRTSNGYTVIIFHRIGTDLTSSNAEAKSGVRVGAETATEVSK